MSEVAKYPDTTQPPVELNDAFESDLLEPNPVIEAYKKDVDRTILRENLKLSPQQRSEKFVSFMQSVWRLRAVAEKTRTS